MFRRLVRRLGRSVRSRVDGAPPDATRLLAEAHHETRTRVEQIEAAHGVTAGQVKALEDAHHLTAMQAAEALAQAEAVGRDAASVAAHLPTLLSVISSHNAATRELKRSLALDEEHIRNLAQFIEDHGATLAAAVEQMRASQDATTAAFAEFDGRMTRLASRADAIRREVLFEARYGGNQPGTSTAVDTHVVRPDRLPEDGPLQLNLGSGHIVLDDHVNVDARELEGVDVVADVRKLPFDPDSVDTVRSAHLLEHFPIEELRRSVLPHWYKLLRPGGVLRTIVPDGETMIAEFAAGRMLFEDLRLVTFGEQDYDGDFHFTMFSEGSLTELLGEAGFVEVETVATGRRNGACYEMELVARKPTSPAPR
jgi:hypothetical protein